MRTPVLVVSTALIALLAVPSVALAATPDPWTAADNDDAGASVEAGDVVVAPVSVGVPGGGAADGDGGGGSGPWDPWAGGVECRYAVASEGEAAMSGLSPGDGEVVAVAYCPGSQPTFSVIPEPAAGGGAPLPPVDPAYLLQVARDRLVLPAPELHFSPEGSQLVQLPSWLWVAPEQWRVAGASASAGSVTATVTAVPVASRWDMGNGDVVVCDGPGQDYERRWAERPEMTDCKYTYRHSSAGQPGLAYEVTGSVEWRLSWTASGAPGGGDLGTVVMSTAVPLRVDEIQAVVVPVEGV